jgi:CheY-like chemotaxis protein
MQIETVVIVDDDQNIRRIAQLSLTRLGPWKVTEASGGQEALALFEEVRPDVLLLDVMMPGMDGPTVLRTLQERHNPLAVPVIFMTAKVMRHEMEEYAKLGAAGTIVKPFSPKELAEQIRSICLKWEQNRG